MPSFTSTDVFSLWIFIYTWLTTLTRNSPLKFDKPQRHSCPNMHSNTLRWRSLPSVCNWLADNWSNFSPTSFVTFTTSWHWSDSIIMIQRLYCQHQNPSRLKNWKQTRMTLVNYTLNRTNYSNWIHKVLTSNFLIMLYKINWMFKYLQGIIMAGQLHHAFDLTFLAFQLSIHVVDHHTLTRTMDPHHILVWFSRLNVGNYPLKNVLRTLIIRANQWRQST